MEKDTFLRLGSTEYFINFLGRVSSDHRLSHEEVVKVKEAVSVSKRSKMDRWGRVKSGALTLFLVLVALGCEQLLRH